MQTQPTPTKPANDGPLSDTALSAAVWTLVETEPDHGVTAEERAEYEHELEDLN